MRMRTEKEDICRSTPPLALFGGGTSRRQKRRTCIAVAAAAAPAVVLSCAVLHTQRAQHPLLEG